MRLSKILFTVIVLFSVLASSVVHAAGISPLEGLEALRKGFAGINDFTAEITQEKQVSIMKRVMKTSGTVKFRKPDQFMMEIKPPYSSRILLKDNVIEQSGGKGGSKNRIILPPEQSLRQWFQKLATPVTKLPDGVDIKASRSGQLYTLQIIPAKKGQVREMHIAYQADGTVRRIVIIEKNGDKATIGFKKIRKNVGLDDKDFVL